MFTRIHTKNVHKMSPKKCTRKVTQKEDISWTFLSTRCHQKCPRDFTPFVHEKSPIMSTRCLPPYIVCLATWHCLCILIMMFPQKGSQPNVTHIVALDSPIGCCDRHCFSFPQSFVNSSVFHGLCV